MTFCIRKALIEVITKTNTEVMTMHLPNDPVMLACVLNTKLRDFYSSLDELCEGEDIAASVLEEMLKKAGLEYNKEKNRVE